ncbi:hypothetical protein PS3A_19820 [Pseudomonas sp. 3A(2025)]
MSSTAPQCFAIRPLSTRLQSFHSPDVQLLDPLTGLLQTVTPKDYAQVDPDVWLRHTLADLDRLAKLESRQAGRFLQVRQSLIEALVNRLAPILVDEAATPAVTPDVPREMLLERLAQQLLMGYDTPAIIGRTSAARHTLDSGWAFVEASPVGLQRSIEVHGKGRATLPLRACPGSPLPLAQAMGERAGPRSVDEALYWDYQVTVQHASAAQDQLSLHLTFNESACNDEQTVANNGIGERLNALAQYIEVQDTLWQIIEETQHPQRLTALATAAYLFERIAQSWAAPDPIALDERPATAGSTPADTHRYRIRFDPRQSEQQALHDTLTLERLPSTDPLDWPTISVVMADGTLVALTAETAVADTRLYRFPAASAESVAVLSDMTLQLTFHDLPILRYQQAQLAMSVVRNAQLLDAQRTNEAFIYRTPTVGFATALEPSLRVETYLPIGAWRSSADDNPLTTVFAQLFEAHPIDNLLSIKAQYACLTEDVPETRLPVLMRVPAAYEPGIIVPAIIDNLGQWLEQTAPSTVDARWLFDLTLHGKHETLLVLRVESVIV